MDESHYLCGDVGYSQGKQERETVTKKFIPKVCPLHNPKEVCLEDCKEVQEKLPEEIQSLCVSPEDFDERGLTDEAKIRISKQLTLN